MNITSIIRTYKIAFFPDQLHIDDYILKPQLNKQRSIVNFKKEIRKENSCKLDIIKINH